MTKRISQPIFILVVLVGISNSILSKEAIDYEILKTTDDIDVYSKLTPEESFLKQEPSDIFSSGKIEHEKVNEKINKEADIDDIIPQMVLREFTNISLLQKGSKCITDIKNGKCDCDGHKKDLPDIAKTNSNTVKLIFSQMNMKKTNLRRLSQKN